jgi:hypothetical protein
MRNVHAQMSMRKCVCASDANSFFGTSCTYISPNSVDPKELL